MSTDERISVTCAKCGQRMRLPQSAAGRRARCPKCSETFVVPAAVEPADIGETRGSAAEDDLFAGLAGGTALERPASAPMQQPELIRTPAKSRAERAPRKSFAWGEWLVTTVMFMLKRSWTGRLCLVAVIFGCISISLGYRESRLRGESKAEPQIIACDKLEKSGPGDNRHLVLTDFVLLPEYVYEEKMGSWNGAWVPAVPVKTMADYIAAMPLETHKADSAATRRQSKGGPELNSADFVFKVVVAFPAADGPEYIEKLAESDRIQGTVISGIMPGFDDDRRQILKQSYPRVNVDDCMILVAGRSPRSAGAVQAYLFGGAALAIAGLGAAGWITSRSGFVD